MDMRLRLYYDQLGQIKMPVPPFEEQAKIVERIECLSGPKVDVLCSLIAKNIERLNEYRAALITAAVTSQIDVTTWGKQGQADRRLDQIKEDMALQEARA